jgi:hypothetical protein
LLFNKVPGTMQFLSRERLFSNNQFVSAMNNKEFCIDFLATAFLLQTFPSNPELFIHTLFKEFNLLKPTGYVMQQQV